MAEETTTPPEADAPQPQASDAPQAEATQNDTQENDAPAPDAPDRPAQQVRVEDAGPARKTLAIEVPEDRVKAAMETSFARLRTEAAIPGFRGGRAPRRLIEKRFGTRVREDVKNQLMSEAYTQAVEDHGLDVLGEPEVKDPQSIQLPDSGPLSFTVEVEVTPDVALPDFAKLSVKKRSAQVTEADVDKELETARERMGRMQPVEDTDARVAEGDFIRGEVKVLKGEDAGEEAEVISEHPGTHVLVNGEDKQYKGHVAGIVVQDLGKRLAGKKIGEVQRISQPGPAQHENEAIRDQPITIVLKIESIVRLEPASTEEIKQRLGVESDEELREQIQTMLDSRAQQQLLRDQHTQVIDQLMEQVDFELPEHVTGRQTERVLRHQAMEMASRGASEAQVEEHMAEMRSGSADRAAQELKQFFIIDKAAKDLDIEVEESEINQQIAMMAMQQGRRPAKLSQEMQQSGRIEQMYIQIREHKTLDAILEKAHVEETDEKVLDADSQAEAQADPEAEAEAEAESEAESEARAPSESE